MAIISVSTPGFINLVFDDVTWSTPGVDLVYARPVLPANSVNNTVTYGRLGIGGHIPNQPNQAYILHWESLRGRGVVFAPQQMTNAGFRSKWGTVPILLVVESFQQGYTLEYGYA